MDQDSQDVLSLSVRDFVSGTGAKTPTPGGGSVAGVVGALAVALGQMSLNFTRGKKKYAEHEPFYEHLARRLDLARQMFESLIADDMAAYRLYQDSTRMEAGADKDQAVQLALAAAVDVPRESAKLALALLGDLKDFAPKCSKFLISDLVASAALAVAVTRLSDYNVRINVPGLSDRQAAEDVHKASAADVRRAVGLLAEIEQGCKDLLP